MPETIEHLKIGGLQFLQPEQGYRFSVDAILLADFLKVKPDERLIDLGAGSGIIPLLASVLTSAREIVGLELQERLVNLARQNVALNHLEDRIQKLRDAYALNNIYQTEALQIIDALQAQLNVLNQLLALEIKDIDG